MLADSTLVPRWRKSTDKRECCIHQCSNEVFASLNKTSEQVQDAAESSGLKCPPTVPIPAPMCKHHYHLVYKFLKPTQTHCITCGISLKHSNPKPCPQPELVENHLKENMGFEGTIGCNDKVCNVCYRSHLVILQNQNRASRDSDLQQIITTVAGQIPTCIQSASELAQVQRSTFMIHFQNPTSSQRTLVEIACYQQTRVFQISC